MTLEPIRMVPVGDLRPDPRNARIHSRKQRRQLARAIKKFGFTSPIVVDEKLNIICGHARWEAAKGLGLENVPVLARAGLREAEKRALAIADNKIAANAGGTAVSFRSSFESLAPCCPNVVSISKSQVSRHRKSAGLSRILQRQSAMRPKSRPRFSIGQ